MTQVNAAAVEQGVSTNSRPMPPGRMMIDVEIVAQKYGCENEHLESVAAEPLPGIGKADRNGQPSRS